MIERDTQEFATRTSFEEASRHLLETLSVYTPSDLRASASSIVWDAREYADWTSDDAVVQAFTCKELAGASFRYGASAFRHPVDTNRLLGYLGSDHFQRIQGTVCDRVPEADVRSLVFFSQGVKYAAAVRRARRLHETSS